MRKSFGIALALGVAATLALGACSANPSTTATTATTGGTLTLGAALDAASWDPADAEFGNRIQYMQPVYDSLLHIGPSLKIEPWLATSYHYNSTNTKLTLKLRTGVTFSDGTAFDADVAKANLEHFKSGTGQNAITLASVSSITTVGDDEVDLDLSAPDPALLRNLALVAGMQASPRALEGGKLKATPVGSGPYELDAADTVAGSQYTYTRNPDYWNKGDFPYDKIVIKPITDLTARLNALKSGQVDATLIDAGSMSEATSSDLTVKTVQGDWQGIFIVDRDGTTTPALADVKVRQAINEAIDGAAILKSIRQGQGTVSEQIFNPTSAGYSAKLNSTYGFSPSKAKKLLAEAGYPNGFDVTMPSGLFTDLDPIVVQQLGDVGIRVKQEPVAPNAAISTLLSGKYSMFTFSWGSSDAWQDILKLVKPTAPWNMYKTETPELDSLIEKAQSCTSDCSAPFQAVSRYLVDNAWFDVWYVQNNVYASNAKTDATMQPQNVVPYIWDYAPKKD